LGDEMEKLDEQRIPRRERLKELRKN